MTVRQLVSKICPSELLVEVQEMIVDALLFMQYPRKATCAFDFFCILSERLDGICIETFDLQFVTR